MTVQDGLVTNVSFVPSDNSPRWRDYSRAREEVERLRALAATAARHGVLAVDRDDARRFGDQVRRRVSIDARDYAAYAYANAGLRGDARSVLDVMRRDLAADLFDVWLFADVARTRPLVPAAPDVDAELVVPAPARRRARTRARRGRRLPALWTTFHPEDVPVLRAAATQGGLS